MVATRVTSTRFQESTLDPTTTDIIATPTSFVVTVDWTTSDVAGESSILFATTTDRLLFSYTLEPSSTRDHTLTVDPFPMHATTSVTPSTQYAVDTTVTKTTSFEVTTTSGRVSFESPMQTTTSVIPSTQYAVDLTTTKTTSKPPTTFEVTTTSERISSEYPMQATTSDIPSSQYALDATVTKTTSEPPTTFEVTTTSGRVSFEYPMQTTTSAIPSTQYAVDITTTKTTSTPLTTFKVTTTSGQVSSEYSVSSEYTAVFTTLQPEKTNVETSYGVTVQLSVSRTAVEEKETSSWIVALSTTSGYKSVGLGVTAVGSSTMDTVTSSEQITATSFGAMATTTLVTARTLSFEMMTTSSTRTLVEGEASTSLGAVEPTATLTGANVAVITTTQQQASSSTVEKVSTTPMLGNILTSIDVTPVATWEFEYSMTSTVVVSETTLHEEIVMTTTVGIPETTVLEEDSMTTTIIEVSSESTLAKTTPLMTTEFQSETLSIPKYTATTVTLVLATTSIEELPLTLVADVPDSTSTIEATPLVTTENPLHATSTLEYSVILSTAEIPDGMPTETAISATTEYALPESTSMTEGTTSVTTENPPDAASTLESYITSTAEISECTSIKASTSATTGYSPEATSTAGYSVTSSTAGEPEPTSIDGYPVTTIAEVPKLTSTSVEITLVTTKYSTDVTSSAEYSVTLTSQEPEPTSIDEYPVTTIAEEPGLASTILEATWVTTGHWPGATASTEYSVTLTLEVPEPTSTHEFIVASTSEWLEPTPSEMVTSTTTEYQFDAMSSVGNSVIPSDVPQTTSYEVIIVTTNLNVLGPTSVVETPWTGGDIGGSTAIPMTTTSMMTVPTVSQDAETVRATSMLADVTSTVNFLLTSFGIATSEILEPSQTAILETITTEPPVMETSILAVATSSAISESSWQPMEASYVEILSTVSESMRTTSTANGAVTMEPVVPSVAPVTSTEDTSMTATSDPFSLDGETPTSTPNFYTFSTAGLYSVTTAIDVMSTTAPVITTSTNTDEPKSSIRPTPLQQAPLTTIIVYSSETTSASTKLDSVATSTAAWPTTNPLVSSKSTHADTMATSRDTTEPVTTATSTSASPTYIVTPNVDTTQTSTLVLDSIVVSAVGATTFSADALTPSLSRIEISSSATPTPASTSQPAVSGEPILFETPSIVDSSSANGNANSTQTNSSDQQMGFSTAGIASVAAGGCSVLVGAAAALFLIRRRNLLRKVGDVEAAKKLAAVGGSICTIDGPLGGGGGGGIAPSITSAGSEILISMGGSEPMLSVASSSDQMSRSIPTISVSDFHLNPRGDFQSIPTIAVSELQLAAPLPLLSEALPPPSLKHARSLPAVHVPPHQQPQSFFHSLAESQHPTPKDGATIGSEPIIAIEIAAEVLPPRTDADPIVPTSGESLNSASAWNVEKG